MWITLTSDANNGASIAHSFYDLCSSRTIHIRHHNINIDESSKGSKVYDAILMDFMMPNMDGPTATGIIKGMGYTGPVIDRKSVV